MPQQDRRELIKAAWEAFITSGEVRTAVVRPEIIASWHRCREYGLNPVKKFMIQGLGESDRRRRLSASRGLINAARPLLGSLFEFSRDQEVVCFLTDHTGFILDAAGEGITREYCQARNAWIGGSFDERQAGTNVCALVLRHARPFYLEGCEHYLKANHMACGAAAPIRNSDGTLAGTVTITAQLGKHSLEPHLTELVALTALVIGNRLNNPATVNARGAGQLTSEQLKGAMEDLNTGIIIIDDKGYVAHMNPGAIGILNFRPDPANPVKFDEIIRNPVIIEALTRNAEIADREIVMNELAQAPRCLVSVRPIRDSGNQRIGAVIRLQEQRTLRKLVQQLAGASARYTFEDIRGDSAAIRETIRLARSIAASPSNVLISGESGTGKEMLAQAIHNAGPRATGPFFAINCAAVPHELIESELFGYEPGTFTGGDKNGRAGKFELAEGGTFFLDEVNAMSLHMQAKLLRVLEERKFLRLGGSRYFDLDVKIIAASNSDLGREVARGNFRSDLFYRLNVLHVHIPPLRERPEDIRALIMLFIEKFALDLDRPIRDIDSQALHYLMTRTWPGNVRELKNWIERAVNITGEPVLSLQCFPDTEEEHRTATTSTTPIHPASAAPLREMEKKLILAALNECQGNLSEAARRLSIGRTTLYRKMKRYGLSAAHSID